MNCMKKLALLFAILPFLSGCMSTESKPSEPESAEGQTEVETKVSTNSLMDLYLSGEIPGYTE